MCTTAPLTDRNTKICMWGDIPDVITPVKFHVYRLRGFWFLRVWKSGSSIDRARRPYNSYALPCRLWCGKVIKSHSERENLLLRHCISQKFRKLVCYEWVDGWWISQFIHLLPRVSLLFSSQNVMHWLYRNSLGMLLITQLLLRRGLVSHQ